MFLKILIVSSFLIVSVTGDFLDSFNQTLPSRCSKSEYFNTVTLNCEQCESNKHQTSAVNKLSCVCDENSYVKSWSSTGQNLCSKCAKGSRPTADGRGCTICSKTDPSLEVATCECPGDSVLIERDINGTQMREAYCVKCAPGTKPSEDKTRCVPCEIPGTNCSCTAKSYVLLPNNECVDNSHFVTFGVNHESFETEYDSEKVTSPLLKEYLRFASYGCKLMIPQKCQFLANMCVLDMYQDTVAGSPCKILKDLRKSKSMHKIAPWIYYPEGDASVVLNKRKVQTRFTIASDQESSYVKIILSKWALNGTWIGFVEGLKDLQLCTNIETTFQIRYLAEFQHECWEKISDILLNELYFYDVYLQYKYNNQTILQPIPILNLNYKMRKKYSNRLDVAQWQLTRRAFIIENGNAFQSKRNSEFPLIVRYLKSIVLRFTVRNAADPGLVQMPLLILSYGQVLGDEVNLDKNVRISLKIEFVGTDNVKRNVDIAFAVLCSISSIWSIIRTWAYIKRSGHRAIDLVAVLHLCVIACGHLANVFFFVVSITAVQSFVYYKWQAVPHSLLPSAKLHYLVRTYIIVAFPLKVVEIINMMRHHLTVDIFLIDWEQPRVQKQTLFSVSAWRTYFVANKWLEIQTIRKTSVLLQLCLVILFLKVGRLENWASKEPGTELTNSTSEDKVFRFAVSFIVYVVIYLGQLLLVGGLYERYIKNCIQEFVDICSLANISVFVLALENYGFYIHGRSAHGFSDTDMATLRRHLRREEEDMVGHRGLVPASDHQTFQIHIPFKLKTIYKSFFNKISGHRGVSRLLNKNILKGKNVGGSGDSVMMTYVTINRFLAAFIEHALKDLDYEVRDKMFIEALLDIELFNTQEKGVFFNDNGHSFDNVLYYGNELTLFTFDLVLFSFVEILSQNSLLAAILTLLCVEGIARTRKFWTRKNLARKALIDEYFLL